MFYKEAINGILQLRYEILYTNNDFGKVYKRIVSIEACYGFFKIKLQSTISRMRNRGDFRKNESKFKL